jgi:sodium-dependent dicarboxylate transporter 2/3/5
MLACAASIEVGESRLAKWVVLLLGPVTGVLLGLGLVFSGLAPGIAWTAGITWVTALWWVFEPIPIPVTSLIPLAMFPLVGVLTPAQVGAAYGSPLILLLLGGFMLSTALEKSGAHRRLALNMVNLFGGQGGRPLVFGFMLAAAVLSMWISNTATTLMLLPIALATIEKANNPRLTVALLLGIAYAASVGGIGTPIGTPPNLLFMQAYADITGTPLSFLDWMVMALPLVVIFVPLIGLWLTRNLTTVENLDLPAVGQWRLEEKRTFIVFAITALLWITRQEPWGGWSELLALPKANDASVALLAVVVMFLVPNGKGGQLLDWEHAVKIPWGILILFGGGIAIASAFGASGLSASIGEVLSELSVLPTLLLILGIALGVTFLTELTSNTATTALLMPILAAAALAANIDPLLLMVPAAMSASCAFMFPVATGPNAIMFGSGRIPIQTMVREGLALNLIGALLVTLACYFALT